MCLLDGVDDVCLSVLTLVDRKGVRGKILNPLTDEEVAIGELIIGNLSSSGYLTDSIEGIAEMAGTDTQTALTVLKRIQTFDPVGVAARDAKECLLAQIYDRGLDKDPVLVGIVSEYLEDFEAKRFKPVMRRFRLDEEDLKILEEISREQQEMK